MADQKGVLGFPRWTGLLSFSGGSWSASYPLANLSVLPLTRVARSADATTPNTQLLATISSIRPVRLLGLVRHNLSLAARYRLTLYSDAGATVTVYAGAWTDVWPLSYPLGSVAYEDPHFWGQRYLAEDVAGYPWNLIVWLDQPYYARAIKLEIDDTANADGFVQAGMLEVAQGWQFSVNFPFGSRLGWEMRTEPERADGGVEYANRVAKPRRFTGETQYLPEAEMLGYGWEAMRQLDRDTPFLWVPRPSKPDQFVREAFLARFDDPGLFAFTAPRRRSMPLSLVEVLG